MLVEALTLVTVGALVGALGTLIGAGGGFLLVPLLLLVYHLPPPDAVGTSLAVVFLNAVSGTLAYLRQRRVDLGLGVRFAAATLPGAIGGANGFCSLTFRIAARGRSRALNQSA